MIIPSWESLFLFFSPWHNFIVLHSLRSVSLSITSHLIFIDGEIVRRHSSIRVQIHPSVGWISPLWWVISCPLFFTGYTAHEREGQPTLTISYMYKPQLATRNIWFLCREHLIDNINKSRGDRYLCDPGFFLLVLFPSVVSSQSCVGFPDGVCCLDQRPA